MPPASIDALRTAYQKGGTGGYWTKLRDLLHPQFSTSPNGWYRLAEINTYLGDKEEAFRWLARAFPERPNWITYLKTDPTLEPLHEDPRFRSMLQQMRLSP